MLPSLLVTLVLIVWFMFDVYLGGRLLCVCAHERNDGDNNVLLCWCFCALCVIVLLCNSPPHATACKTTTTQDQDNMSNNIKSAHTCHTWGVVHNCVFFRRCNCQCKITARRLLHQAAS